MEFVPGTIFQAKYEILGNLGEGGMGCVYKARQIDTKRIIALKLLHSIHAGDKEHTERFHREAKALSSLQHINIVTCYHFGISDFGIPYVALEYLHGKSLRRILDEERHLSWQRSIKILRQVSAALVAAHELGIIHRDLKPANIILLDKPEPDFVKVVDFGLAKLEKDKGASSGKLTKTGYVVGSLHYLSPEQACGLRVDARSDVYSCGCILFETITGQKPFETDNDPVGLLYKHQNESAPEFSQTRYGRNCPLQLELVCRKALRKDPDDRYQTMSELIRDLDIVEAGQGQLLASVPSKRDQASRKSKLIRFAMQSLAFAFLVSFAVLMYPFLMGTVIPTTWQKDFAAGISCFHEDHEKAESLLEKAFAEAGKRASIVERMNMHRGYAIELYRDGEYDKGDREIDKCIALSTGIPQGTEAIQLACAYQDKAWSGQHMQYLKDPSKPPGDKNQERACAIVESAFGSRSTEVAYKQAALGVIYTDMKETEKAHQAFARATKYTDTDAKLAASFVWASLARCRLIEKDYQGALDAFMKARSQTYGPKKQQESERERANEEFREGLKTAQESASAIGMEVLNVVPELFKNEDYNKLDKFAEDLRKQKQETADGFWILDWFYFMLDGRYLNLDEQSLKNRIHYFEDWIVKCPSSPTARIAQAECYLQLATKVRGDEPDEAVSKVKLKLFKEYLEQARADLFIFGRVKKPCPRRFATLAELAISQKWNQQDYQILLVPCHKQWPTYQTFDFKTARFLLPPINNQNELRSAYQLAGLDKDMDPRMEMWSFVETRIKELPVGQRDKFFARMVWFLTKSMTYDNIFSESNCDWSRVKRGFNQIMAEYPKDQFASLRFAQFALDAEDFDCLKQIISSMDQ